MPEVIFILRLFMGRWNLSSEVVVAPSDYWKVAMPESQI
jgi:hypothetical protein